MRFLARRSIRGSFMAREVSERHGLAKHGLRRGAVDDECGGIGYVPGRFSASRPVGLAAVELPAAPPAPRVALVSERSNSLSKGLPVKTRSPAVSNTNTRGIALN